MHLIHNFSSWDDLILIENWRSCGSFGKKYSTHEIWQDRSCSCGYIQSRYVRPASCKETQNKKENPK